MGKKGNESVIGLLVTIGVGIWIFKSIGWVWLWVILGSVTIVFIARVIIKHESGLPGGKHFKFLTCDDNEEPPFFAWYRLKK
jgi:hypothetical protein